VLNAFTIVFAALLIPFGKLADRIGHRRVFLGGSAVFTAASMACGLAPTAELLILFRVAQAAGAAALIPASLALVMHAFPRERIPYAVAIWGSAGAIAGALGPTVGAAVVEGLGWRWAFYINLPIGLFTVLAGSRVLRESSDPTTRVPALMGVVLVIASAGTLSYAIVDSDSVGWLSGRTLGLLALGGALLAAFVAHQRRTDAPALDLDLFRLTNFTWGNAAAFAFGIAFSAMFFGSILFLTEVWGWSVLEAGFGVAPGPALVAVVAPRAGKLAGRIGQRPILLAGGVL
jgi:EmrB/QacA subfamily drug resistance transporter